MLPSLSVRPEGNRRANGKTPRPSRLSVRPEGNRRANRGRGQAMDIGSFLIRHSGEGRNPGRSIARFQACHIRPSISPFESLRTGSGRIGQGPDAFKGGAWPQAWDSWIPASAGMTVGIRDDGGSLSSHPGFLKPCPPLRSCRFVLREIEGRTDSPGARHP